LPHLVNKIHRLSMHKHMLQMLSTLRCTNLLNLRYLNIKLYDEIDLLAILPDVALMSHLQELRIEFLTYRRRLFKGRKNSVNLADYPKNTSVQTVQMLYPNYLYRPKKNFATVAQWAEEFMMPAHCTNYRQLRAVFPNLESFQSTRWFRHQLSRYGQVD